MPLESQSEKTIPILLGGSRIYLDAAKLSLLFSASKALASTTDLDALLHIIAGEVRMVIGCQGAAMVLYDEEKDDFYWRISQDPQGLLESVRDQIRIPKDHGVVAWVFKTGQPALINDAANDPRVYRQVEARSGFTTWNMICVPLKGREKMLGVLYALNKVQGPFTQEDVEILVALAGSVGLALENASQYEELTKSYRELERLHRVKTKLLHHLSHELKTPLAIIEASLKIMERRIRIEGLSTGKFPFERISRNLARLKLIEKQVAYIVDEKGFAERNVISRFLDHLKDLIEIEKEDELRFADAMEAIKQKLEELFPEKVEQQEGVDVAAAFQSAEAQVRKATEDRDLSIEFVPPDPVMIVMQPQILMSVLLGLVRNAVENTPDQGKVVVKGERTADGYRITVRDHGIGIPESEQPNIFEGFYPVQETDLYSSGRRYAFNAGGTGTDLLKIKLFSERFGFNISFKSRRCPWIPTPRDICPGDISRCSYCTTPEDCYKNGGTEFVVDIPPERLAIDQEAVA
jgi:signal transduction histidine kinase